MRAKRPRLPAASAAGDAKRQRDGAGVTDPSLLRATEALTELRTADAPPTSHSDLLASFVHPLRASEFMSGFYRQKCLVVHADPARFAPLVRRYLFDLDLGRMLEASASDAIFVWMKDRESGKTESIEVQDVRSALVCHAAGASLYFR